jgi:RNA polymerase sigma-70 factor (ECF subfamily)
MALSESSIPDERLVADVLAGDDSAFTELTSRHKSRVFGVAARFAQNAAEIDDICQDVFVQAYFKLRQFRGDSPFEHWLLRITTFKCYDYLRKKRRGGPSVSVDAMLESGYEPTAPDAHAEHPQLERLRRALTELPPEQRLVITLLELEERTVQEIAESTGWSMSNVKVRAFRARASLRKLMEKPE